MNKWIPIKLHKFQLNYFKICFTRDEVLYFSSKSCKMLSSPRSNQHFQYYSQIQLMCSFDIKVQSCETYEYHFDGKATWCNFDDNPTCCEFTS